MGLSTALRHLSRREKYVLTVEALLWQVKSNQTNPTEDSETNTMMPLLLHLLFVGFMFHNERLQLLLLVCYCCRKKLGQHVSWCWDIIIMETRRLLATFRFSSMTVWVNVALAPYINISVLPLPLIIIFFVNTRNTIFICTVVTLSQWVCSSPS